LGILPASGVPTDDQFEQFLVVYNSMALGMQADGPNLYRLTQLSLTVPANVGYAGNPFVMPNIILGLLDGRWVVTPAPNLYERPLGPYSYEDYMRLPNKLAPSSSGPSIIVLDKQVTASWLYFWPLPTFGGTCNVTVARQVNSIAQPTDPLDFPPEWWDSLSYVMADRLAQDEGIAEASPATMQQISQKAAEFLAKLENFDRPTSVMLRPYGRAGTGKIWR
jgi:hypothetical protein